MLVREFDMKKQHVLFGISPFNSKFNESYINEMLLWGFNNYINVDVLHPYEEARYLLMGCGDDEGKAKKKSRKEYCRVERVIDNYLLTTGSSLFSKKIIKFHDFYNNSTYKSILEKVRRNYHEDEGFHYVCLEQSRKAIMQRKRSVNNHAEITQFDLDIAVEYIIRELPFILSPSLLLSVDNNIHISYYCTWPVLDYLNNKSFHLLSCFNTRVFVRDHVA